MTTPNQKFLNQLLIFMNLHQHAKNQAISLIIFRNIVDLTSVTPGHPKPTVVVLDAYFPW